MANRDNPFEMPHEQVEARYFQLKGRCDWISTWIPRIAIGAAVIGGLATGGLLLAGAAGAGIVASCAFAAAVLPMGLSGLFRDSYEMEMHGLRKANDFHVNVAETKAEQAREVARKELSKEFERIADHGGTREEISVKGPLRLKLRERLFAPA